VAAAAVAVPSKRSSFCFPFFSGFADLFRAYQLATGPGGGGGGGGGGPIKTFVI